MFHSCLSNKTRYLYGLCQSLENVKPEHILKNDINCDDTKDDIDEDLLSVVGSLCGSIKKWSRGDQEWEQFQPRIQLNVSRVLAVINKLRETSYLVIIQLQQSSIQQRLGGEKIFGMEKLTNLGASVAS